MKTIRVRIAVAVTPNGCWDADGCKLTPTWEMPLSTEHHGEHLFSKQGRGHVVYVEADVPLPDPVVIEGTVTP